MKIIGHRGAAGLAPENTLASIKAALAAGVDQIEIDVRVTTDDVPILNHDKIEPIAFAELQKQNPNLITLKEAIGVIKQQVPVVIEVKPRERTAPIVTIVQSFFTKGWRKDDIFIGSKSHRTLLTLHKALPGIPIVVIESWSGVRASWRARKLHTKYVCMNHRFLWWGFIKSMANSGYKLSTYTLNDPKKAQYWAAYGLYGVVTDYPDRFTKKK